MVAVAVAVAVAGGGGVGGMVDMLKRSCAGVAVAGCGCRPSAVRRARCLGSA